MLFRQKYQARHMTRALVWLMGLGRYVRSPLSPWAKSSISSMEPPLLPMLVRLWISLLLILVSVLLLVFFYLKAWVLTCFLLYYIIHPSIRPSISTWTFDFFPSLSSPVLEGKGVKVGLITTEGYKQILHIDRSYVPGGLAAFIIWNKGELLAPLECTIEVWSLVEKLSPVVVIKDL